MTILQYIICSLLAEQLLVVVDVQMAFCNPSTKLSAVVHVGSLSGVARRADQTSQEQMEGKYELHGPVLDECREILTKASNIKVTKDAVDEDNGVGCESLTLVPDSSIILVSKDKRPFQLIFG